MPSPSSHPQKKPDFYHHSFKNEVQHQIFTTMDDQFHKISLISANIQHKLISDLSKANKNKLTISIENSNKNKIKKLPSLKKIPSQEYKSKTEQEDGLKNVEKEMWKLNYMQKINHGLEQTSAINGFIHEDKVWIDSDFNKSLRHIDNKYHKKIKSKEKNNGIFIHVERKNNLLSSDYQSPTNHSANESALERKLMLSLDPKKNKMKLKSNTLKKNFKNVGQWISNIKEILRTHEYSSLKRQLENAQEKFSQIIAEIAETLSNDSVEQGIILEYIWETHMNMAISFLEQKDQELNKIESKKEKEFEERKAELIEKLDALLTENNDLKTQINDKDIELSKCLQESNMLNKEEGKIKDSYRTLINFLLNFKEQSELKLLENIQLKIKNSNSTFKKGEIEALKLDYDKIASNCSKEREHIKKFQNDLSDLKKKGSYSSNLEKINEILEISLQNFKKQGIYDFELKSSTNSHKEISIDTNDLVKTQTKSINTEKKMCNYLDKYVQTLFFDEIEHEGREVSHEFIEFTHELNRFLEPPSASLKIFKSKSEINTTNLKIINESEHNWKEHKNNFAFSRKSNSALPDYEEFEVFSLKKLSRNFESEIFKFIENFEEILASNLNLDEDNQLKLENNIYNIRILTETFFKTVITRDVSRTKEILQHKINSYETKLSTQELQRSNQVLVHNLKDIKLKFEEFFKASYDFSEKRPIKSENEMAHSTNLILDSSTIIEEKKDEDNEMENGSLEKIEREKIENEEKKEEQKMNDNDIGKKMRKSNTKKTVILNEEKKDENKQNTSSGKKKNVSKRTSIMKKSFSMLPSNNQMNHDKKNLMIDDADFNFDNSKFDLMKLEVIKKDCKLSINNGLSENLIRLIKEANSFLPRNKKLVNLKSDNFERCLVFLMRIETSNLMPIKTITSNTLIKIISNIYSEIIKYLNKSEVERENLNPLFFIVYDFFVQRYINSKDRAETFFLKFIQNLLSYLEIPRISFFAKLLGISRLQQSDEKNSHAVFYDGHDLIRYFEHFCKLDDNPIKNIPGLLLAMNYQEHLYTALTKAVDVFNKFCNSSSNFGFIQKMKLEQYVNQIKESKVDDPIVSRRFVVEIDFVIEILFELQDYIYMNYETVFKAVDVEGKEALSLQELILLVKNIENKYKYSFEREIIEIFNKEFDYVDEERNVNCISFKRFAAICHKKRWCSPIKQETFIRKHSDEIRNFESLMEEFDVKKNLIKLKFLKTGNYNDFYFNLIKIIENTLEEEEEDINVERKNKTWLQYRILDQESNSFVVNMEIEACLPIEFKYLECCQK